MRKVQPELVDALDDVLMKDPDFQLSIKNGHWRYVMVAAAKAFVDTTEATGRNDGLMVSLIQKTVDGRAEREPYCMAFDQTLIGYTELKCKIKSQVYPSEHCLTVWNNTPENLKTKKFPNAGYLPLWNYYGTPDGHTGCLIATLDNYFKCVEANAYGPDNKTQGIFLKYQPYGDVGDRKLLGYISPF